MLLFFKARRVSASSMGLSSTRRMLRSSMGVLLGRGMRAAGEREVEGRALINLAVRPDVAAVATHDALDGCEAYAGSLEFPHRVQSLEHAEQLGGIGHVEADSVVAHEVDRA